jgi:DNA-binding NtrC family response regulator
MPDTDGVTLLKEWAAIGALTMPVIMMSGHATIDTAVEATRIGAIDFLEKPIALQKLLRAVQKGLDRGSMRALAQTQAARPRVMPSHHSSVVGDGGDNGARNGMSFAAMPSDMSGGIGGLGGLPMGPSVTVGPFAHGLDPSGPQGAFPIRGNVPLDLPLREARDAFERAYFEYHLAQENGSMTRVAEKTGLERTHLYRKLKQLGIELNKSPRR